MFPPLILTSPPTFAFNLPTFQLLVEWDTVLFIAFYSDPLTSTLKLGWNPAVIDVPAAVAPAFDNCAIASV